MDIRTYFNNKEKKRIREAIKSAELMTSGELRVHIESVCENEPMERAVAWFEKLKMHETEARNGVLIYVALESKKFAILGDKGINAVVPPDFWDKTKDEMLAEFKAGKMLEGICKGIESAGTQLKKYFPYQTDDINELEDDISYGEK